MAPGFTSFWQPLGYGIHAALDLLACLSKSLR